MSLWHKHAIFEKNSIILLIGVLLVISIGGLVEVLPLFYMKSTIEQVEGMRPYTPLELAGRDIYVREGCYLCHSQMIRALRDEVERYGHYSLAAESMYDHPFQWGSKRIGPDLARVGNKYSDEWHRQHLTNPRSVVPASIMPGYPWLARTELDVAHIGDNMRTLQIEGTPYTQEMIDNAQADVRAQAADEDAGQAALAKRYPKVVARNFAGQPGKVTEADAVIAYLQMLGTSVDFKIYDEKANIR
jgi:cytochrome c oxidase cbb3-type subunit 2